LFWFFCPFDARAVGRIISNPLPSPCLRPHSHTNKVPFPAKPQTTGHFGLGAIGQASRGSRCGLSRPPRRGIYLSALAQKIESQLVSGCFAEACGCHVDGGALFFSFPGKGNREWREKSKRGEHFLNRQARKREYRSGGCVGWLEMRLLRLDFQPAPSTSFRLRVGRTRGL